MTERLRAAMTELAEEVAPVDLTSRVLHTSRRQRVRRIAAGSAAAVTAAVLASGVAYAFGTQPTTPRPEPAGTPTVPAAPTTPPAERTPTPSATPETAVEPTTPASPSTGAPARPPIPTSAMLRAADIGPGYRSGPAEGDDHGSLAMIFRYCGETFPEPGTTVLASRSAYLLADGERAVLQRAMRFAPGQAEPAVQYVRTLFTGRCESIDMGGNPSDQSRFRIEAVDIAGNSALLIREDRTNEQGTTTNYRIVIEQLDMFTEIRTTGGTEGLDVYGIARSASQRLCAATPGRC
jgi:hypothetical protein